MKKKWKGLILLLALCVLVSGIPNTQAAIPTVKKVKVQVESYYNTLRKAFYLTSYSGAGACNGWVESVINKSGLVGKFVVGGDVETLYKAMKKSNKFELVASLEGGSSGYQEASNQMVKDVGDGKIKAGDIVIYTRNMTNMSASGAHWLHAAIVMKETFTGTVTNYVKSGANRWKSGYIGYPTIGHALAPAWGVEYNTPMTTPSTQEATDDGSTGYYVFRINTSAKDDDQKKETTTEKKDTKTETKKDTKKNGWKKIDKKWYYYENGKAQTGWKKVGSKWYYLNAKGVMKTGWQKVGKKWYYMSKDGAMQTGWLKLGKKYYFLTNSGAMKTGWKKFNGKWYYFMNSGAMITGKCDIKGKKYTFDAYGVCQNP